MIKRAPEPPRKPLQAEFVDGNGHPDYEAFDAAMEQYQLAYQAWYEEHGRILDEIELAWTNRERELTAGRWY